MRKSRPRAVTLRIRTLGTLGAIFALGGCVGKVSGVGSGSGGDKGATSSGSGTGSKGGSAVGTGSGGVSGGANTGSGSASAVATGSGGSGATGMMMSTGSGGAASSDPTVPVAASYARLTRAEYQATIKAAFGIDASIAGVPDDSRIGPYTSNIDVSPDPASAFMLSSEDLAALIVPTKIAACTAATASTCIPKNFQPAFEKLYRRALTAAEVTTFANMLSALEKAGVSSQDASREMVSTVLMSSDFLFRTTPVGGAAARGQQLAEQLSYALWDAPPDADLTTAAQGTATDLGSRLKTQALRLSKDARAVTPLARFVAQWLRVDVDVELADPTYATNPVYVELTAFVQDALTNNVPVTSFVNGTKGFIQKGNFAKYGMTAPSSTANVVPVTWPADSPRRGMIGQELIMDATRHPDATRRPIFRGNLVQSSLLCTEIPPPSPELQALAGEVADRTTDIRCSTCHLMMEPVGAAFAAVDLDHTGAAPQAVINGNKEVAGTYPDLPTLLDKIAKSQTYADCFSRNLLGFFLEQEPKTVDKDAVADISSMVKAGSGFGDVVAQMVVTLEARSKSLTPWCAAP